MDTTITDAAYVELLFTSINEMLGDDGRKRKPLVSIKSRRRFAHDISCAKLREIERWFGLKHRSLTVSGALAVAKSFADKRGLVWDHVPHFFAGLRHQWNKTTDAVFGTDRSQANAWHRALRREHKRNRKLLVVSKKERIATKLKWLQKFTPRCVANKQTTPALLPATAAREGAFTKSYRSQVTGDLTLYPIDSRSRQQLDAQFGVSSGAAFNYDKARSHWSNLHDMFPGRCPTLEKLYDDPAGLTTIAKTYVQYFCINGEQHKGRRAWETECGKQECEAFYSQWAMCLYEVWELRKALKHEGRCLLTELRNRDVAVLEEVERVTASAFRYPMIDGAILSRQLTPAEHSEIVAKFGSRSGNIRLKPLLKPWEEPLAA